MSRFLRLTTGALLDSIGDGICRVRAASPHLLHRSPEPTAGNLRLALARGCRFLRRAQRLDGAFVDFLLPPGASDTWISAHVGFVLERVAPMQGAVFRAVDYLERSGTRDGLWGYNRRVAPDLDSTAQAVMTLQRYGRPIEPSWIGFVLAQQTPSGGFPTYAPTGTRGEAAHGWQTAHPDVTLVVAELLGRLGYSSERERAFAYLRTCRRGDVVPPYWWNTESYCAWASARAGFDVGTASARARRLLLDGTSTMPSLPMLLSAAAADGSPSNELTSGLTRLLAQQAANGSWPCDPCLRVTLPEVMRSGEDAPGPPYAGLRRVFSTAHAVAAIVDAASALRIPLT